MHIGILTMLIARSHFLSISSWTDGDLLKICILLSYIAYVSTLVKFSFCDCGIILTIILRVLGDSLKGDEDMEEIGDQVCVVLCCGSHDLSLV